MYLNTEIEARVIEMDRNRNNVVLSRRVLLEEGRKNERAEILSKLEGHAPARARFPPSWTSARSWTWAASTAWCTSPKLSWNHVNHPSEVVKVGDEVEVEVLDVDLQRERISLGLKQTTEDPWIKLVEKLSGGIHRGRQGDQDRAVRPRSWSWATASRVWCTSPKWPCATSTRRPRW